MSNLQNTLDALQPYVIGIRYIDGGVAVVDAIFKEGWVLPESNLVKKAKGNDDVNYYMIFSEKEGIGLDELLEYVSATIKTNIEREKKHELLREMVNELKLVFKKNTLANLKRLKFTFGDEELVPDLNEFDLDSEPTDEGVNEGINEGINEGQFDVEDDAVTDAVTEQPFDTTNLSEEDLEILEEEKRAANFFKIQEAKRASGATKKISSTVELPPKKTKKIMSSVAMEPDCDCGDDEACDKCIEFKDY